jgi:hypothetical protein
MSIWTRRTMGLPWLWQSPESSPSSATRMHDFSCRVADPALRASTRRQVVKAFAVPPFDPAPSFRQMISKWLDCMGFGFAKEGGRPGFRASADVPVGHGCHSSTGVGMG